MSMYGAPVTGVTRPSRWNFPGPALKTSRVPDRTVAHSVAAPPTQRPPIHPITLRSRAHTHDQANNGTRTRLRSDGPCQAAVRRVRRRCRTGASHRRCSPARVTRVCGSERWEQEEQEGHGHSHSHGDGHEHSHAHHRMDVRTLPPQAQRDLLRSLLWCETSAAPAVQLCTSLAHARAA